MKTQSLTNRGVYSRSMRHKRISREILSFTLLLVAALLLPCFGLAEDTRFEGPIACERMTIDSVQITRGTDETTMEILYTLNDPLSAEDKEALELMFFNIMQSAEDTEFPTNFHSGSSGCADESIGADTVAGQTYREETLWDAWDAMPEAIYIRPYYKLLGEWGDVVILETAQAAK